METLAYWIVLGGIKVLQSLPLRWVARIGRGGGGLVYLMDARHRKVARANLAAVFGQQKSAREIRQLTREHFRRLGENYASAIKTSSMSLDELKQHLSVKGSEKFLHPNLPRNSRVFAIGHFGNFELYARANAGADEYQFATTYRGLNHPQLDRLLSRLRDRSGCLFFERRHESGLLREAMAQNNILLGLLSDQHAGGGGAWIPFLGRICSTNTSAAVFAQRYKLPLFTAVCYRTALAEWCIEIGDEIPTLDESAARRSTEDIMTDVNQAFEVAVRRDPANWFWVHNRWKPKKKKPDRRSEPAPLAIKE